MKKLLLSLVAAGIAASASSAHAQTKIATVDMTKIFNSYYKTKEAESRINDARNSAKQELDERLDNYKKSVDQINKYNDDLQKAELSKEKKDDISKKRDDIISETKNLEREIGEFRGSREKQLQDQAMRMRNGIVEEITKLVQDKVKSENFDLVIDRSGSSLNGVPVILYARENLDFSDEIIVQLNKNKPKDSGPAPAAKPATGEKPGTSPAKKP